MTVSHAWCWRVMIIGEGWEVEEGDCGWWAIRLEAGWGSCARFCDWDSICHIQVTWMKMLEKRGVMLRKDRTRQRSVFFHHLKDIKYLSLHRLNKLINSSPLNWWLCGIFLWLNWTVKKGDRLFCSSSGAIFGTWFKWGWRWRCCLPIGWDYSPWGLDLDTPDLKEKNIFGSS